jgi:hypothetical protein
MKVRAAALGLLGALLLPSAVGAAPCGRPDVDATFPPHEAAAVPSDAQLSAHYASPATYDDEPVDLTDADGNAVALAVSFDDALSLLRAAPEQPLAPGPHRIAWPGLRGVSGAGVGRGLTATFTVGTAPDAAAPTFAGLEGIDWDLSRERDPCLDRLDDRFVFRLQLGAAADDAGTPLLSLLVFETRAPAAPNQDRPTQVALRPFPKDGALDVRRPASAAGRTCFAAVVQDLVGNVSGGGEREVCVATRLPPFFDGCALRPARRGSGGAACWLALLTWLWSRRGRSAGERAG